MTKCNKPCPFTMEGKEVKGDNFAWKIIQPFAKGFPNFTFNLLTTNKVA